MSPLWLLPVAVLVAAVPVIAQGVRAVVQELEALHRETTLIRSQLRPAVIRLQHESDRLAQHRPHGSR